MLENAAKAAEAQRKYDVARKLLDSSLAIRKPEDYGIGLLRIAQLERKRHVDAGTEGLYLRALSALGDRPEAADGLLDLGFLALTRQNMDQAYTYFQQAQAADPKHAGRAFMWMAAVEQRRGNAAQAESFYNQALAAQDPDSLEAAITMDLFARFLDDNARTAEAAAMRDRAASIRKARALPVAPARPNVHRVGGRRDSPQADFQGGAGIHRRGKVRQVSGNRCTVC